MAPAIVTDNQLQIQQQSSGIFPDLDASRWHICYYSEEFVNRRDEEYYFPCSNNHNCCGRECCTAVVESGFPLWAALLIGILALLFLIGLLLCILYLLWKRSRKTTTQPTSLPKSRPIMVHKTPSPTTGVKTYRRVPSSTTLRRISDSNIYEINTFANSPSINTVTTTVSVEESDYSSSTRNDADRWFRQSRPDLDYSRDDLEDSGPPSRRSGMRESYENVPKPIRVSYHEQNDLAQEIHPLVSQVQTPEEQRAQTIYYRPGSDRVASYNELPK